MFCYFESPIKSALFSTLLKLSIPSAAIFKLCHARRQAQIANDSQYHGVRGIQ